MSSQPSNNDACSATLRWIEGSESADATFEAEKKLEGVCISASENIEFDV